MEGVKSESIGEGANRRVVISSTNPSARPPRDNRGGQKAAVGGRPAGRGGRDGARGPRPPRKDGEYAARTSTPAREFADRPRDPSAAPTVPKRTETINDGADLASVRQNRTVSAYNCHRRSFSVFRKQRFFVPGRFSTQQRPHVENFPVFPRPPGTEKQTQAIVAETENFFFPKDRARL